MARTVNGGMRVLASGKCEHKCGMIDPWNGYYLGYEQHFTEHPPGVDENRCRDESYPPIRLQSLTPKKSFIT